MNLRKYILPKAFGDYLTFIFLIGILPFGYWFEVFLVFPTIYSENPSWCTVHSLISTFLFINITSNFVYMILVDTSILGEIMPMPTGSTSPAWKFCTACESITPPRSWHCKICNICILKRDHHCQFAGCCVGHHNHRYFLFFLFYLALGTTYTMYFNTLFIPQHAKLGYFKSLLKLTFSLAVYLQGIDHSAEHGYTLFYVINLIGMLFAVFLLYYHGYSAIKGIVMYEQSHKIFDYDSGSLKQNIMQVLGERWYLTWLSPFIQSKLPCDGINWLIYNYNV